SEPAHCRLGRALVAAAALAALAPHQARAQMVMLRIQPHPGDTMYTTFVQDVEMIGTRNVHSVDTTMTSRMNIVILSHSVVQANDGRGTTVLAITDSVAMVGHGTGSGAPTEALRRAMQGRQARLQIAPDGSATLLAASDDVSPEVEAVYSGMPATLPEKSVAMHGTWERNSYIPISRQTDSTHAAMLHTVYRLDSLSDDGTLAYISIRGTISRDSAASAASDGLRVTSAGTVTGRMSMNRKRGWWVASELTISIKSVVTPAEDPSAAMRVQTRITQSMRTTISP
ncbi:MAG: DUF6263 family protein, partial [Gemmatimonadaceae bacterium]